MQITNKWSDNITYYIATNKIKKKILPSKMGDKFSIIFYFYVPHICCFQILWDHSMHSTTALTWSKWPTALVVNKIVLASCCCTRAPMDAFHKKLDPTMVCICVQMCAKHLHICFINIITFDISTCYSYNYIYMYNIIVYTRTYICVYI